MVFFTFSSTFVVVAVCFSAFLLRAIYRLTLHPLAQFPGPFWTKVSSAYGMSFDFSSKSRGFILELPKLDDTYGMMNWSHMTDNDTLMILQDQSFASSPTSSTSEILTHTTRCSGLGRHLTSTRISTTPKPPEASSTYPAPRTSSHGKTYISHTSPKPPSGGWNLCFTLS